MLRNKCALILVAIILLATASSADSYLAGRHRLDLRLGGFNGSTAATVEVGPGGVGNKVENSGFLGGVAYSRWLQEDLAYVLEVDAIGLEVGSDVGIAGVSTRTAILTQVLFGVRYYLPKASYGDSWRPYLSGMVGPVVASYTATEVGLTISNEAVTETAVGAQVGGGLDIVLSRRFIMGASVGYNLMSDFDRAIGERNNYSGPVMGFSFGLLLGRGR